MYKKLPYIIRWLFHLVENQPLTIIEPFRKGIIAWIVEFCKIGGIYVTKGVADRKKNISSDTNAG